MTPHHITAPAPTDWRKSSYSNGGEACVEVAPIPGGLAVRDSKDTAVPGLNLSAPAWNTFIAAVTDRAIRPRAVGIPSPRYPGPGCGTHATAQSHSFG
ncbi:DUF397 domain-containing protein [Streptomyces sp. ST2-7A]|uniref:DUF397 domain-containing protein n=1 Tax=Streptomyces sp. ST2-7A TaxID=2907214 RepID=UPI001F3B780D|nr:DUF397 domain-containing protein [Streptomyces sp. ST2-7A]MCE7081447.1 DUF397 domain-containing protein [Streptomyces sp. ST2-7A]